ncbi:MAG: WYL domain-containing protein [Planctomycetes bacterium]|nr:WYL domain-containing protein [Planctomycetota bacterium]
MPKAKPVQRQILRLSALVSYLQKRRIATIDDICKDLGTTKLQLIKDVDQINLCGLPPYSPHDYVTIIIEDDDTLELLLDGVFSRPVSFARQEACAVDFALTQLPKEVQRGSKDLIENLRKKLLGIVPVKELPRDDDDNDGSDSQPEETHLMQSLHDRSGLAELLSFLQSAIDGRRVIEIVYFTASRDELTKREVEPLAIVRESSETFLIAGCRLRNAPRSFRVDRIAEYRLTDEVFEFPKNLDIRKYRPLTSLASAKDGTEVRIAIEPGAAERFRRIWPFASFESTDAGGAVATIHTRNPEFLYSFLLPYEGDATIIAPKDVREGAANYLRKMLDLHRLL